MRVIPIIMLHLLNNTSNFTWYEKNQWTSAIARGGNEGNRQGTGSSGAWIRFFEQKDYVFFSCTVGRNFAREYNGMDMYV